MIKPLKEEYTTFLFNKNKNTNDEKNIPSMKSKKLLVEIIRKVIEDESEYYKFKDENYIDIKELWEMIFKYANNKEGLDKIDLNKLFEEKGNPLSQYDLDIIFNKLDYNDDLIISFDDLNQEFNNNF